MRGGTLCSRFLIKWEVCVVHVDTDKLKKDLKEYFGTAMFGGSPLAMMDMVQVEGADENELLEIAKRNGFDITDYLRLD